MQTICIETHIDSAIWWWIRLPEDRIVYSTLSESTNDLVRAINISRFNLTVIPLSPDQYSKIIWRDYINIQIWSNNGSLPIPWLYSTPKTHPILSKSGLIWIIQQTPWLDQYIPKSIIINKTSINEESCIQCIQQVIEDNFIPGTNIVIKNSIMDGNGNWVWFVSYDNSHSLSIWLQTIIDRFTQKAWGKKEKVYWSDYVIQEYINNKIWEWSISFSIQNTSIEKRGLANNIVWDWEFFWSTNYHSYLDQAEIDKIQHELSDNLLPVLEKLQKEWVRGNIWFDILYQRTADKLKVYILESNGIYRTTWSTLPSCFCYNTKNKYFIGIPIIPKYLNNDYIPLNEWSLLTMAKHFISLGTKISETQIINIKSEWINIWYPVIWIAGAWPTIEQIQDLYLRAWFLNSNWQQYVKKIFASMQKQS